MRKITAFAFITALAAIFAQVTAHAATEFDFKDAKGVNSVAFMLDAPLESISGTGNEISGVVTFDPEKPEATQGSILLQTASLMVTNSLMRDHMLGEGWLNAEAHPEIIFSADSVKVLKQDGTNFTTEVTGSLTLKGVTRALTVPVTFTYLKDKLAARTNGKMQGDLLVIRSNFTVNRSDFGIKPGENTDKVAETIELRLAVAGAAPRS